MNLDGYLINFTDTAGIRDKNFADKVEKIGIENSIETIKQSEIVIFLFENDLSEIDEKLIKLAKNKHILYVQTKCDIDKKHISDTLQTSSMKGFGITELKNEIIKTVKNIIPSDTNYTTNKRQQTCLIRAKEMLENVINTANTISLADLCASDMKNAILALDEITGEVLTDKILENIFDNFCIGK